MSKKDWEINNTVKQVLTKNHIDTLQLKISTVKDSVNIKGKLNFKGGKIEANDELIIIQHMRKTERELKRGLKEVKHIKWDLEGWDVRHNHWRKMS
ncbi:MAG: hypothetical protein PF545_03375 [Elusimicrobia bacterium]|nr:hypothetical protein [Elusimicrobiota bacterium]